jgi:ribose transport system permease protein
VINDHLKFLSRFQSVIALALVLLGLSLASGSWDGIISFWRSFVALDSALDVLLQISINLCLSIGMTLIILSGGIDLSVGSVLALAGAVAAGLFKNGIPLEFWGVSVEPTVLGAMVVGIAVGLALGWINGFLITRFRLPPFVATLGMLSVARGLTMLWTKGANIADLGEEFDFIGTAQVLRVPMPVWISLALAAVFAVVTKRTCFGRYLYAVGGNERAAAHSGLDVDRIKWCAYALGGGLAAVAGLLLASKLNAATPNAGTGYELDSIGAVVIGGTSLSGGRGSIGGTLLGCLVIGILNKGLLLLRVSADWQMVVKGFVIWIAVAIDRVSRQED